MIIYIIRLGLFLKLSDKSIDRLIDIFFRLKYGYTLEEMEKMVEEE